MKWSNKIAAYFLKHGIIDQGQVDWFIYGLEKRLASACIFLPFFLIAVFWTTPLCAVSLFVSFFLIRRRTSGFHANSVGTCLCISLALEMAFLGVVYPILHGIYAIVIASVCFVVITFLAPYNHPNMNFTEDEISACRVSARLDTGALWLLAIGAHFVGLSEVSKGISLGIAMAALLLCLAYISEWRK